MRVDNCLFCKIVGGEIKATTIYENDSAVVFLDVNPRAPGHTLVIPKYHAPTILALPDQDVEPFFMAVKHAARMLSESLRPDGITIGANQGPAGGQEVDHLHVHLIPRWHNDGGGSIQSVVDNPPEEPIEIIAKKIIAGDAGN